MITFCSSLKIKKTKRPNHASIELQEGIQWMKILFIRLVNKVTIMSDRSDDNKHLIRKLVDVWLKLTNMIDFQMMWDCLIQFIIKNLKQIQA